MSNCEKFLDFFDDLIQNSKYPVELPEEVEKFYSMLKNSVEKFEDKPVITEMGLQILEYLQTNNFERSISAREIAEGMELPSRKVSGAMRKLVTEEFVEKYGQNPVMYALGDKGKNFNIKEYKENM